MRYCCRRYSSEGTTLFSSRSSIPLILREWIGRSLWRDDHRHTLADSFLVEIGGISRYQIFFPAGEHGMNLTSIPEEPTPGSLRIPFIAE